MSDFRTRVTLHFESLTTAQLREAIVAHRHAAEETGPSITKTDGDRRPFVGVAPCEMFSMVTLPLTVDGALSVLGAVAEQAEVYPDLDWDVASEHHVHGTLVCNCDTPAGAYTLPARQETP